MKRRSKTDLISKSMLDIIKGDSIFGDVMLGTNFFNKDKGTNINKSIKLKNSTDRYVKVCPECSLAWEYTRITGTRRNKKAIYYKNFPKYGKKIEVCNRCNEEEN